MKKILLIVSFLALIFSKLMSQDFCNMKEDAPNFLANAPQSVLNAPGPFTVRIFVYIIRTSSCEPASGMTASEYATAMNNLVNDFAPHNICFSLSGKQDICDDLLYYNDVPGVFSYINNNQAAYLHPNAIDIFFCPNTSGSPGGVAHGVPILNAPPGDYFVVGGTFPANTWAGVNYPIIVNTSHVVSHEMGHCFGLWHTHHGQPGCEPQGCEEHDISPYNINCGDLVQDTPADRCIGVLGNANYVTCTYTGTPIDLFTGLAYAPDMHNFMSYVSPSCYQQFSQGQGQRMKSFIASNYVLTPRVVPQNVYVQNKLFTVGTTLYAGTTSVTAGSNVTVPPNGTVDFKTTAKVEFKSNNYISLEKGFIAEPGVDGNFYAHIDPAFCSITNQVNSGRFLSTSYYPLLDKPKWYTVIPTVLEGTSVRKIEDMGDTLINGTIYSIINVSPINLPNLPNTYFFYTDTGNYYLREDIQNKKVFMKNSISGLPDSLIYDFSLNIGDTFPNYPNLTLTYVDTILIAGGYRNRFIFVYGNDSVIWIEGVGNPTHPLGAAASFYYPGYQVICSYQNDTLIYDEGSLYTINCGSLTTSLNQQLNYNSSALSIFPNPANNSFSIIFNLPQREKIDLIIFDALGKVQNLIYSNTVFEAGKNEIKFAGRLKAGIYFIKLTSKSGNYISKICITE
jgi:hypothetical protein